MSTINWFVVTVLFVWLFVGLYAIKVLADIRSDKKKDGSVSNKNEVVAPKHVRTCPKITASPKKHRRPTQYRCEWAIASCEQGTMDLDALHKYYKDFINTKFQDTADSPFIVEIYPDGITELLCFSWDYWNIEVTRDYSMYTYTPTPGHTYFHIFKGVDELNHGYVIHFDKIKNVPVSHGPTVQGLRFIPDLKMRFEEYLRIRASVVRTAVEQKIGSIDDVVHFIPQHSEFPYWDPNIDGVYVKHEDALSPLNVSIYHYRVFATGKVLGDPNRCVFLSTRDYVIPMVHWYLKEKLEEMRVVFRKTNEEFHRTKDRNMYVPGKVKMDPKTKPCEEVVPILSYVMGKEPYHNI